LKYWLESLGYEVMLSEYNDFDKPLDEDTFNACLDAVRRANYYVLLIGSRVGALYDSTVRISVTRMEYRTAYELAQRERIKILVFVRKDLWIVRDDRQVLEEFLAKEFKISREIQDSSIHAIVNHPSNVVNDSESTFSFLDEVSKNEEMKQAVAGKGPFPTVNWIYPFSTFQDIVDALRVAFKISDDLSRIALRENLKRELLSNLVHLTRKHEGNIDLNCSWASFAKKCVRGDFKASSIMPGRYLRWLVMFAITGSVGHWLSTQFLDQSLISGEFLEYDPSLNTYKDSIISDALFRLRENIGSLKSGEQFSHDAILTFIVKYNDVAKQENDVSVSNSDLLAPLGIADLQQNIVALSRALIKAFNGDYGDISSLKLSLLSPLPIEAERIKSETATIEEIADWINAKPMN
jgi:hypothetical protein